MNNIENEEIQFIPLLKTCFNHFIHNWIWFALSVILCASIGWFYKEKQPRIYSRQAVMLIEDGDAGSPTGGSIRRGRNSVNSLLELNGVSVGDNLKNELFILSSRRLMLRVVDKLKLDVDYTTKESLHQISLYGKQRPFEVLFQKEYKGILGQNFTVEKKNANTLVLKNMKDKEGHDLADKEVQLGQMVATPLGTLCIVRGESYDKWENGIDISVSRLSHAKAAQKFLGSLSVSEYDKESSLIVLTCNDVNPQRGTDILNTLFDAYKEDVVENKNRVAQNTGRFIDERIRIIGEELSSVESQLASFKKQNQLVDFNKSSQVMLDQTTNAHQQTLQLETQLNVARYLNEYINSHTNSHDLIPALNVGEASFNTQIASYNEMMNQRNQTVANSSENQAMVRDMDRQLQQMRHAISQSLRNYVSSLEMRLRDARSNENMLTGRIAGAPEQEKRGLDIQRQQSLKEALYTYLLNKREEVALQQAINEANVRMVEEPIGSELPISPRPLLIMFAAIVIGFMIPALIIWLRYAMDVAVHSRKDIEKASTIPVLGEIPHQKNIEQNELLIDKFDSNEPIVEAFRILRFSMRYMRHNTQVVMFTSSTPGHGKSFISRNFASIIALGGKRVLLIDADIRKRTLSIPYGHNLGLTTYLSDEFTKPEDIIKKDLIAKGVDFIPAGSVPPNPSELLMSERLPMLIEELRKMYDHIIIDSTPMFAVADASVVERVADMTAFIIRAGVQDRDFLVELDRMYKEKRFKNLCVILNDVSTKNSKYGYGFGYGAYKEEQKRSRTKMIMNKLRRG